VRADDHFVFRVLSEEQPSLRSSPLISPFIASIELHNNNNNNSFSSEQHNNQRNTLTSSPTSKEKVQPHYISIKRHAATMTGEQFIQSNDGTQIYVKQFHAEQPIAQVLVLHGYLEHCLRYTEFAEYLCGKQISVTTYDFRGHGKSGGDRALLRKWKEYDEDLETVRSTLNPNLPTFILGHSCGGLTTLSNIFSHSADDAKIKSLKGVILTCPYVEATDAVPWMVLGAVHTLGRFFPALKVPSNLKPEELTSDPVKQQEQRDDVMCQASATIGWASQGLKTQERVKKMAKDTPFPLPLLYIYATDDKVANPKVVGVVGENLQSKDKTVIRREGEEHEVLNETNRMETYEIISAWILKRL
jgi:acylglycerol lipase